MVFSNEDKIIIQIDSEEKNWSANKVWKNHHSKKWECSSECLLKEFRETSSMDRRRDSDQSSTVSMEENKDLIEELACSQEERPHTHLVSRKIAEQTGISRLSIQRMMKKRNFK